MEYVVEINTFDWDSDNYISEWRKYYFTNRDSANEFYDLIINLDYDESMVGRPCTFIYFRDDEILSDLLGIHHGGVFKETIRMYRITTEKVSR